MFIGLTKKIVIGTLLISSISFAEECQICRDLVSLIEKQQITIQYNYNNINEVILKKLVEIYEYHLEEIHGKKLQKI